MPDSMDTTVANRPPGESGMSLIETLLVLSVILLMIQFGWDLWQDTADEALLESEFVQVRGHALEYAGKHCALPPTTPEPLPDVLTDLGSTDEGIRVPANWRVGVTARPGGAGIAARVLYETTADSHASRYFLRKPGATRDGAFVSVPVHRITRSVNRGGFRFLMSDRAC